MSTKLEPIGDSCGKVSHESRIDARDLSDELGERLDDASGKWECIAHGLGVDVSLLSHWTSGRGPMPAYRLIKLTEVIGPGLLRWIAKRCGYALTRISHEHGDDRRSPNEGCQSCTNQKASRDGLAS